MTGTTEVVCSNNRSKPNPKPKPNDRTSTETNNKPLKLTPSAAFRRAQSKVWVVEAERDLWILG